MSLNPDKYPYGFLKDLPHHYIKLELHDSTSDSPVLGLVCNINNQKCSTVIKYMANVILHIDFDDNTFTIEKSRKTVSGAVFKLSEINDFLSIISDNRHRIYVDSDHLQRII